MCSQDIFLHDYVDSGSDASTQNIVFEAKLGFG